ncbi:GNAT family N-acetyltransferase [Rhodococcus sp. D2-41]|uniref:GNAT family N-acetyltransferase n=1 Tax=Speluncibacter jeojiensis TaxID=2710754 RepID=A0A9X4M4P1_9ACTN|nr:GNAT family N-acetyltransferase [Rhodococcus sp. D2-41]MDG3011491.1 GNAT family N-acetyltransferase [Rhodococcus sp. D2-41]MDG3015153.1 GNAT family N-acetyltransferase [Corynebacteriales bacterium D3-21]
MTTGDQAQTLERRELLDSLARALEQRHQVLDAIIESTDRDDASRAVQRLLDIPEEHAEAVLTLQFWHLNRQDRRRIQQELEDVNSALDWTPGGGRADRVRLRPFSGSDADRALFRARATEPREDGTTLFPEDRIDDEIAGGLRRINEESTAWLVAEDPTDKAGPQPVGLVIGELVDAGVEVRLWVTPEQRKQGYGTALMLKCPAELAAYFPGVSLIVRTAIHGAH